MVLALVAMVALLLGSGHGAGMAAVPVPANVPAGGSATPACHRASPGAASVEPAPEKAKAAPAKPACCPDGCAGDCTPAVAFFAGAGARLIGFLRTAADPPALAQPVIAARGTMERPPKPFG
jgi:hypothetical protein